MINSVIFKSYDIRGIYPSELNEEAACAIGRAYAREVRASASRIVVGSDARTSGPALKAALVRGITDEGVNVVDIGLVPIDAVYYAVRKAGYPAGVMITASHNPKEYNGFKMPLPGIGWIRGEALRDPVMNLPKETATTKGAVEERDIMPDYIKHILSFIDVAKIKPFKVVVDAGNGLAGKVVPLLEPHLPITVVPLNFTLDGNFPAHPSNPLLLESQKQIRETVVSEQADFGEMFDGYTDRLFFVNERGEFVQADLTLLLLAREFLNREPGAGIVYNVICSRIVPEKVREWGGRPIRAAVGFVNLMEAMSKHDGIVSGEVSAHYSFRDNGYADSGFIAWLILMQLLSQDGRMLSEIIKEFQKYHRADEVNITLPDSGQTTAVLQHIKEHYRSATHDELDGLTVSFTDWWFNVRPSNTEPLLRLTVEAGDEQEAQRRQAEVMELIKKPQPPASFSQASHRQFHAPPPRLWS